MLGAAGGAYSASRYEQDRQHQSQDSANRHWYYRGDTNGYNNNGYNNNGTNYGRTYGWNPPVNNSGYNNGYNDNNGYDNGRNGYAGQDNSGYNGQNDYARRADQSRRDREARHDNGKHQGWDKKQHKADQRGDDHGDRD